MILFAEHNLLLPLIALFVCCIGALVFTRLAARARRAAKAHRLHWLFLAGLCGGAIVWTTHFIAMLGFAPDLEHAFEPRLTLASLAVAVLFTAAGVALAAATKTGAAIEAGGAVFGLGIGAMHYIGMAAFLTTARLEWDIQLVAASVVAGMVMGAAMMSRLARPVTRFCRYGSAIAMVLAIVLTHFVGMAAITLVPDPTLEVPPQAISDLAMVSFLVAVLTMLMGTGFSAYRIDIHSHHEAEGRYRQLSLHDPLTALPNRDYVAMKLAALSSDGGDFTARIAVVAIGLDRFKDINDVHGHAAGDRVLKAIAERLAPALEAGEFLARLGGDEFVAVKQGIYARREALAFGRRLQDLIEKPVRWNRTSLGVQASLGTSVYPDDASEPGDLMSCADIALQRAKSSGRRRVCAYDRSMDEDRRECRALAMDLRHALARGEFELHYQPQNDARSRETLGFEVLLRWNHPTRGMVSPGLFIPLAEEDDLILEIGEWVLRTACAEAASWHHPYRIAVNVAARQLTQSRLANLVHTILLETGLPASRLEIEITESGIVADQLHALHVFRQLKSLGTTIAMDDYGTGYSSLSTLKIFPFDKIKIDREFVASITTDRQSAAIVQATVLLGNSLDIPVLAEGVETEAELAWLNSAGCHQVQGYLFGKPAPPSEIMKVVGRDAPQGDRPAGAHGPDRTTRRRPRAA